MTKTRETIEGRYVMAKWICNVCGYIHEGDRPPDTCPVCSAPASEFEKLEAEKAGNGKNNADQKRFLGFIAKRFPFFQFHPIMVHFPSGLIPAAVFFLVLAILFDFACVERTAFYLLCTAIVMSPFAIVTGVYNWKTRYRAAMTPTFMFKLYGGIALSVIGLLAIGWRLLNPHVVDTSPGLYFIIHLVLLILVAALGHIGGRLVFAGRK